MSDRLREVLEKHEYVNGACLCGAYRMPLYTKEDIAKYPFPRDIRWALWSEHFAQVALTEQPDATAPAALEGTLMVYYHGGNCKFCGKEVSAYSGHLCLAAPRELPPVAPANFTRDCPDCEKEIAVPVAPAKGAVACPHCEAPTEAECVCPKMPAAAPAQVLTYEQVVSAAIAAGIKTRLRENWTKFTSELNALLRSLASTSGKVSDGH